MDIGSNICVRWPPCLESCSVAGIQRMDKAKIRDLPYPIDNDI